MRKLTKQQAILIGAAIAAAICIGITIALLAGSTAGGFAAPKVTLNGDVICWEPVGGAEGYVVIINGTPYETTETSYKIQETAPGLYDIQVQAVKKSQTATSEIITYRVTEKLSAPVISLSGNVVAWPAVKNAAQYEVLINGKRAAVQQNRSYAIAVLEIGEYVITVKALGDDIYTTSDDSNAVTYSLKEGGAEVKTLDAPMITLRDGVLSWSAVEHAGEYKILLNGIETYTTTRTSYQLPITLTEGAYALTVVAANPASGIYLDSAQSNTVTHKVTPMDLQKPLLPVINVEGAVYTLSVNSDGYMRIIPYDKSADLRLHMWYLEKASDSKYYRIKLFNGKYLAWANSKVAADGSECMPAGKEETAQENLLWLFEKQGDGSLRIFNLAHSTAWHTEDGAWVYFLGVKGNDAGTADVLKFGDNCYPVSFVNRDIPYKKIPVLPVPNLSISGNTVSWNKVNHAVGYEVFVNGVSVGVQKNTGYQMKGYGSVSVIAVGDNLAYLSSVMSNHVSYTVDLRKPILPTTTADGVKYVLGISSDGYLRPVAAAGIQDFKKYMWYPEADGDTGFYHIKLFNGKYLAWTEAGVHSDGTECSTVAKAEAASPESIQWNITMDAMGGYRIYNIAHSSRWSAGAWEYYYGINGGVLKFANNSPTLELENRNIPYVELASLSAPVLSISGKVVSWNAVPNAVRYEVYVNGTYQATVTETAYTMTDYGSVKVLAKSNGVDYLDGPLSKAVAYTVDLNRPILPATIEDGVKYVFGISSDGYLRPVAAAGIQDFKKYMWYPEADGDTGFYHIKLFNGKYLAWTEAGVHSDGTECSTVAKAEAASPESIQWNITMDAMGGYRIYNIAHSSRWSAGTWTYHYGMISGVLKFADHAPALELENRDIPYTEIASLTAPVLSISGKVVSWNAVPDAVRYEVYVNGTYQTTVTGTAYTVTGYGSVKVLAKSNGVDYLDSPLSEAVTCTVDLTRPVMPSTVVDGVTYLLEIDTNGYVRPVSAEGITDFAKYTWYPEADGDTGFYHIKLFDGRYLSWAATVASDGTEGCAVLKAAAPGDGHLQWNITMDAAGNYRIYNVAHSSHWSAGQWVYYYGIIDGVLKFANNAPTMLLENNDIALNPDNQYVERPVYLDNTWVGYFNVDGRPGMLVGTLDGNGVMLASTLKGELASLNGYLLSFEQSASSGWYYVKLANGLYMTRSATTVTANGADFAEIIFAAKGSDDVNQLFRLVEVNAGQYKLESKYYADQGGSPKYLREYWGVFKFVENSGEILYLERKDFEETSGTALDLTKPVVPTFDSDSKTVLVPDGQETKIGSSFASLSDYTQYAWLLEKVGSQYKIRLADGRYLYSTAGGSLAYAKAYSEANANDFLWTLTPAGDGRYKLCNVSVGGYPLTADAGNGNFHFYSDLGDHPAQLFAFTNVEGVTFAAPQKNEDFSAWLYYNNGSQTLAEVNSDGIVVIGGKYDTVSDHSPYVWTFEKITVGEGAGLYRIRMTDGRYLSYADTSYDAGNGHTAQAIAAAKVEADPKQWWMLVPDGTGRNKLENKYLSGYYANVYLGEYWGVYKFDGVCASWTFNTAE